MTVPPGRYEVVAYARGVGGAPYVTAGYTGQNPSCGQALQVVEVAPNTKVGNIVILRTGTGLVGELLIVQRSRRRCLSRKNWNIFLRLTLKV